MHQQWQFHKWNGSQFQCVWYKYGTWDYGIGELHFIVTEDWGEGDGQDEYQCHRVDIGVTWDL